MASETAVQQAVRLEYARRGYKLFRNNSGMLYNEHGTPVRYGLGNDSRVLNRELKSSDLIGWNPRIITPADVGCIIAQFVSFEAKPSDWRPARSGQLFEHEEAQRRWINLVSADGGEARFVAGV